VIKVALSFVPHGEFEFDILDWGSRLFSPTIIDQLVLPALTDPLYAWDTALFATQGKLRVINKNGTTPQVRFAVASGRIKEGQSSISVALQLDRTVNSTVTVPITITGTATLGVDYTVSFTPVVFAAGETAKTVTFNVMDDPVSEGNEGVTLSIGTPVGAVKATPGAFALTIEDNDKGSAIGETWTLRNPLPSNEDLTDVASSGSVHVAVGSRTSILRSVDGINWTSQNIGLTAEQTLTAIEWTGTQFVAVGTAGHVVTSPDGLAWTIRTVDGGKNLRDLAVQTAGATVKLIAVGDQGSVYMSLNQGLFWQQITTPALTPDLLGVVSATIASVPTFIAVGKAGTVLTSTTGDTWTAVTTGIVSDLNSIAWNNSLAVAVGAAGNIYTSPTGSAWTAVTSGTVNSLLAVSWDGVNFIASGAAGTLRTSTNGSTWAAATIATMSDKLTRSTLTQASGMRLMVGGAGTLLSSANGTSWTERSVGVTANLNGVVYNSAEFFAVGAGATVLHSALGQTWAQVGALPTAADLNDIAAATSGTQMVAVGAAGTVLNSTDGTTWTAPVSGTAQRLNGVIKATTNWVAVGDAGTVLTSPTGATWATISTASATTANLLDVVSNGNMIVAVGEGGTIIYSNDAGATWSAVNSTVTSTLRGVQYDGALFVVAGGDSTPLAALEGIVLISSDGVSWSKQTAGVNAALAGAAHTVVGLTKTRFAVGSGGSVICSANGTSWASKASGTSQDLADLAWNGTTLVSVGAVGTIISSTTENALATGVYFATTAKTDNENVLAGAPILVEVRLSSPPPGKVTVPYTISLGSTATKTTDYTVAGSSLVFDVNKGEFSKIISITVKDDGVVNEGSETVIVTLGTPTGGLPILPGGGTYTLTIVDTDSVPTATLITTAAMVPLGSSFSLDATVTGMNAPLVQWRKAAVAVPGVVGASYTFPAIGLANAGRYSVKATNLSGSAISGDVEIAVVDTADHVLPIKGNATAVITVGAAGNGLSYAWYKGLSELNDIGDYSGTHTAKLSIKTFDNITEEGLYHCVVTRDTVHLDSGNINVVVAATPLITGIADVITALPVGRVGAAYQALTNGFPIPIDTEVHKTPTKYIATGLAKGLAINAATGVISGRPTVDGTFKVMITASNPEGASTWGPLTLVIDPVNTNAMGTYVGLIDRSAAGNSSLGARLDLTTTKDGAFTGKLTIGAVTTAFKGGLLNTATAALPQGTIAVPVKGRPTMLLSFDLNAADNTLVGTLSADAGLTTVPMHGWRNRWSVATAPAIPTATIPVPTNPVRAALYNVVAQKPALEDGNVAIPQGDSFVAITLVAAGTATVKGKAADGSVLLTTAPLGPTGQVLIYQPLYTNTGSVLGEASINDAAGSPAHKVTGNVTWSKAPAAATAKVYSYKAGFAAPIVLTLSGGKYTPATSPNIVMSLPVTPGVNAHLMFDGGGVGSQSVKPSNSITNPNADLHLDTVNKVTLPVPNNTALSLTITAATGAFTGTVTLTDGSTKRKVTYQGLIIPDADQSNPLLGMGYGYFTLSQLPQLTGETITTTPILSGLVEFGN
jgi:photosystem II stability/assembly factor-like uncharacterized protein